MASLAGNPWFLAEISICHEGIYCKTHLCGIGRDIVPVRFKDLTGLVRHSEAPEHVIGTYRNDLHKIMVAHEHLSFCQALRLIVVACEPFDSIAAHSGKLHHRSHRLAASWHCFLHRIDESLDSIRHEYIEPVDRVPVH